MKLSRRIWRVFLSRQGIPRAIIKDGDYTLQKDVRLWSEKHAVDVLVIADIGHSLATALKKQYENTKAYKRFIQLTTQGANRLRQTEWAFLISPKLRSKGRFQSIGHLGQWADKMLAVFAVPGRAPKGSLLAKLRQAMPGFLRLKLFIQRFARTAHISAQVMEILKNNGLDRNQYEQCWQLAATLPSNSRLRKHLQQWLQQHLSIQQQLTDQPLLVSSDIIESLFGNFKHIIERSPQADMNRTTLLIPALCGTLDLSAVTTALSLARHVDLHTWEQDNIPYTLCKKRQAFFNTAESQKAGNS